MDDAQAVRRREEGMIKQQYKSVVALFLICALVAVMLAATNALTAPEIERREYENLQKSLKVVLPTGDSFTEMDLSGVELPKTIAAVYQAANGGYAVKLTTSGYSSGLVLLCGISADGIVVGSTCLSSSETLGYEKTFGERLVGHNSADIDSVDAVSNATKTTVGYRNAVKDALLAVEILKGGEAK
jgi:Na+-translocating ferredoxin:NAD+ oxidoreductase RnfG subunit